MSFLQSDSVIFLAIQLGKHRNINTARLGKVLIQYKNDTILQFYADCLFYISLFLDKFKK